MLARTLFKKKSISAFLFLSASTKCQTSGVSTLAFFVVHQVDPIRLTSVAFGNLLQILVPHSSHLCRACSMLMINHE